MTNIQSMKGYQVMLFRTKGFILKWEVFRTIADSEPGKSGTKKIYYL